MIYELTSKQSKMKMTPETQEPRIESHPHENDHKDPQPPSNRAPAMTPKTPQGLEWRKVWKRGQATLETTRG